MWGYFSVNRVALEFVEFVMEQNPEETEFVKLYDAMSRAAAMRTFRGMGYWELKAVGVSFSLLATGELDELIREVVDERRSGGI